MTFVLLKFKKRMDILILLLDENGNKVQIKKLNQEEL